ncbi:MAG TPA: hypothetical protein DD641_02540 [Deltaproteobacteria bacterium]|nr:hypothetical protein [Deltaproteobacteria bacterium]
MGIKKGVEMKGVKGQGLGVRLTSRRRTRDAGRKRKESIVHRPSLLLSSVFCILLFLTACGKKAPPKPPLETAGLRLNTSQSNTGGDYFEGKRYL